MGVIRKISPDDGTTRYILMDGNIAPLEGSSTVTKTGGYKAGDQLELVSDGKLYTATADIAEGGTIVTSGEGQNVEESDSITDQINKRVPIISGAGAHNAIYRGKYLGSSVSAEQYAAISAGTFDDLYIGDYWTIGSVNYRIAAFDYWLRTGDTECTTHHVVIVPDTALVNGKMNSTNITTGAYIGSDMYTGANSNTALATAKSTIKTAFGESHILSHKEYFQNAVTDGHETGGAWYASDIDLMNENMVYGTNIFQPRANGSAVYNAYTIDKSQLPLFAHDPSKITIRAGWWLRGVVSATAFAYVDSYGNASSAGASASLGVRPAFAIKASA